tara:strand:- start:1029 stop:3212 length:2184 start_codon:yes stop_codon:yes gene_type:complete
MQTFYEHLKEDNSPIDSLGHDMPMTSKRKKQLENDRGIFKDFPVDQWIDYNPPSNSSIITKQELKILQSYEVYRNDAKEFMELVDTKLFKPFKDYYKKHDLPLKDLEECKLLRDQFAPIVLQLKIHYNRPRPQKLSKVLTFFRQANFNVYPLKTAETPSYPSGHATEGRFISLFLADKVPFEHKGNIKRIGDDIGNSRQIAGVHYPSDTEFGHQLAGAFYSYYKDVLGLKETKLHFDGLELLYEGGMKASGEDIFKRNNKDEFIKRGSKGELVDVEGNILKIKNNDAFLRLKKLINGVDDNEDLDPSWKTLHKDAFGVIHSKIDKIANGLSTVSGSNPKGEDWESIIAVAVNKLQGKKWNQGDEWDRAEKFWGDWEEQGMKLGQEFINKVGVKKLEQLGASTLPISKEWKGTNKTPKTDLIDGKKKISLKKAGGSQLLSAGKFEAISTVESAMRMYSIDPTGKRKVESLIDNLEKKMIKLSTKDTVGKLEKLAKKSNLSPADKKKVAELDQGQLYAKELTTEMENLFNSEALMKEFFCWEAATGENKFGKGSQGVANQVVTFKETGKITDILDLKSPSQAGKILAKGNNFYVSFKSSSGSPPYLSLRSKKLSNKQLIANSYQPTFAEIIKEECAKERIGMQVLHEGKVEQLDEFQMFNRLVSKAKNVASSIKNQAKKILDGIMKRMKAAFDFIKKQGRRLIDAVLNFFGLDIKSIKITGGGKYPIKV